MRSRTCSIFGLATSSSCLPQRARPWEAALKRIKVRASKYRSDGRSYRVTQHGDAILIVRVPFGQTNKLASWEQMAAGDVILLSDKPTAKQIASAKNTANYLNLVKVAGHGLWRVEIDAKGRLLVRCYMDRQGRFYEPPQLNSSGRPMTPAQMAAQRASNWRTSAAHIRGEARRATHGNREALFQVAEAFERKALEEERTSATPAEPHAPTSDEPLLNDLGEA